MWLYQFSDIVEDHLELRIVFALQRRQLTGLLHIRSQQLPQMEEGTHEPDVDLDRPRTAQDAGEHSDALLGDGVGQGLPGTAQCCT